MQTLPAASRMNVTQYLTLKGLTFGSKRFILSIKHNSRWQGHEGMFLVNVTVMFLYHFSRFSGRRTFFCSKQQLRSCFQYDVANSHEKSMDAGFTGQSAVMAVHRDFKPEATTPKMFIQVSNTYDCYSSVDQKCCDSSLRVVDFWS